MSSKGSSRLDYQCSFCAKNQSEVQRLIAGPGRVFICDECIHLCQQIINEEEVAPKAAAAPLSHKSLSPKAIFQKLDEYVIGQHKAKKVLSVAVYNHYKRIWSGSTGQTRDVELQKSNILLIGPTGCGKTLLAQTLAKILEVPFSISDATSITEAGYVGEDVEHILLRLIQSADWDITKAEQGIAYIDEVDKIARKGSNPSITRDVSGEGVQQGLLKIIEGTVANVPPSGGRKHPHQEFLQIKTDNILFICGGTFDGLEQIVEKRVFKDKKSMGFRVIEDNDVDKDDSKEGNILEHLIPEDLLEFGFIPEFVGRMPVIVGLDALVKKDLVSILTQPKNAVVKQFQRLFAMDKVDLSFSDDALETAAEMAYKQKTGARGLRTIIEKTLLDVMYELPSLKEVRRCIIDADVIRGDKRPALLTSTGLLVELQGSPREKSA